MKLSDVRGERVFDVMADIIAPVCRIAKSNDLSSILQRDKLKKGEDPRAHVLGKVERHLPNLIREHHGDVVAVLASIEGVSTEEYMESMTIMSLYNDVYELLADESFLDFLSSSAATTAPESLTSA